MLRNALFLLFGLLFVSSCAPTFEDSCISSLDCFQDETCSAGACVLKPIIGTNNGMTTNNGTNNGEVGPIDSVDILPVSTEVVQGLTVQLLAEATDAEGNVVSSEITWSSKNDAIATVDSDGLVTAVSVGTATIVATTGEISGESEVIVLPIIVDRVNITPQMATVKTGETAQFSAEVLGTDGMVMAGETVAWSTTDETIITVDQNGLVTAVAAGSAQVIGLVGTVQGFGEITVDDQAIETIEISPDPATVVIGGTTQLTALAKTVDGTDLMGRVFTWSSSDTNLATVDADGLVTGVAPGAVTITAEAEGKMATLMVTVTTVPVDRVEVGPAKTFTLALDDALQLTVTAYDSANQPILGRTAVWSTSDATIATVSSLGEVLFLTTGVVTLTVEVEGQTDSAVVTIEPSAVATVNIDGGGEVEVIDGLTLQLTTDLRDSANNQLTGRTVTWATDDAAIATVDMNGLVTGVALGSTTIRATSEGVEGTFALDVVAGPVDNVSISPNTATISIATPTVQLTPVLTDASGNPVVEVVTWMSSNTAFATVDANGLVTRVGPGSVTISAVAEGITGFATITVAD